jgi:hypothetical protein
MQFHPQLNPPFHQGQSAEIRSIEEQEVESKQHQAVRLKLYGSAQGSEVRNSSFVLNDDVSIKGVLSTGPMSGVSTPSNLTICNATGWGL